MMNKTMGITVAINIDRIPGNFRKSVFRLYLEKVFVCQVSKRSSFCGAWVFTTDDRKSDLLRSDSFS